MASSPSRFTCPSFPALCTHLLNHGCGLVILEEDPWETATLQYASGCTHVPDTASSPATRGLQTPDPCQEAIISQPEPGVPLATPASSTPPEEISDWSMPLPVSLSYQGGSPLSSRRRETGPSLEGSQAQLPGTGLPQLLAIPGLVRLCQARSD